jgi:hypothetical protein
VSVRPFDDRLEGEFVAAVEPPIAPRVDAGWRRRLNLFTGRALSDTALQSEQQGRGGRLATAGQTLSHGVVSGLEVGLETADELVQPESVTNHEIWPHWPPEHAAPALGETAQRWYLHVAPGFGLAASGEDVIVPSALRIPLDELWVYITPQYSPPAALTGSPPAGLIGDAAASASPDISADASSAGAKAEAKAVDDAIASLPPTLAAAVVARTLAVQRVNAFAETSAALTTSDGPVTGPPLPGATVNDTDPLRAPVTSPPEFRGPLWKLLENGTPLPPAAILVLEPIAAEMVGNGDPDDPSEQDPAADAFADWQVADGCRLALYAWPWPDLLPDPARPTWRNEIAELVFRFEAAALPGEHHPWEQRGVALGLVGFEDGGMEFPRFVDSWAVVRDGGKPLRRKQLVSGAGDAFLWQARMQQFAEQVAEADWTSADAAGVFGQFRFLPPAGLLPRAAADENGRPRPLFPPYFTVDAVPVPTEQLDVAIAGSASLTPYDLEGGEPDALRVLVPVPAELYEPRLLATDVVDPEFQRMLDLFSAHRREMLGRREDLRRKTEAVVGAFAGKRPVFPPPEKDPERLDDEGDWTPDPRFGERAHDSPLATGQHWHGYTRGPWVSIVTGDTLFAWVHLNPVDTPRQVALSWLTTREERHYAYWGENVTGWTGEFVTAMGPLPEAGAWVRLEVQSDAVKLQDTTVYGMTFLVVDGYATWDRAGVIPNPDQVWFTENLPAGAVGTPPVGNWVAPENMLTFRGYRILRVGDPTRTATQSFDGATATLAVRKGDSLVVDVRLDPNAPPTSLMLQWNDGTWEHRAYWGSEEISLGGRNLILPGRIDLLRIGRRDTPGRHYMGELPKPGEWARLVVPAAAVGLEDKTVKGMGFTVYRGSADFDRAGVRRALVEPPGTGLTGSYYTDAAFTTLKMERVDGELDLLPPDRGGRFDPVLMGDVRSIRWEGQLKAQFSEPHNFVAYTNAQQFRMWLGPDLILDSVNRPPSNPGQWESGARPLVAGKRYDVKIEYVGAAAAPSLAVTWSSLNQNTARLPERFLYPAATAGGEMLGPPQEIAWVDDAAPGGADLAGGEGWQWVSAPVFVPPEDEYLTEPRDGVRASLTLDELRDALAATPLRADEQAQLDAMGVDRFAAWLDAKVRAADDWVDFGFLRVQADMYRLRKLMVGTASATRLATSPALAAIINGESAATVRDDIVRYLEQVRTGTQDAPKPAASAALAPADRASLSADATASAVVNPSTLSATRTTYLSSAMTSAFRLSPAVAESVAAPLAVAAPQPASMAVSSFTAITPKLSSPFIATPVFTQPKTVFTPVLPIGVVASPIVTPPITAPKIAAELSPTALAVQPIKRVTAVGGVTTSAVLKVAPIVGEKFDFRTVTVAERMQTPPANEAKSFAMVSRFEILDGLRRLDLYIDDLGIPGFVKTTDGVPEYRSVYNQKAYVKVPVRTSLLFGAIKDDLAHRVLDEPDPENADEPIFFSIGVELLDATISALRAVEGRVQQYRDAVDLVRGSRDELVSLTQKLDLRIKEVEDGLAEARHDVTVARALLAEETERVAGVNARRATVLREHVRFLAFHRPRLVYGNADAPMRPLDPAYVQTAVPAALADASAAPPELRSLVEVLREAPLRWFPGVVPLLDKLDRTDVMMGTIASAKQRALGRLEPGTLETFDARQSGKLGEAIGRRLVAQKQVVGQWRGAAATLDLAVFRDQGWRWMRDQAVQVLSLGDLIDAAHGRSDVDRGATRELDNVLRVATSLYRRFGEVLPVIRLEWADRLSEFDDAVNLRNLYSLPRWGELPYMDRRDMQSLVDWLYGRVEPTQPEAVALASDLVRICLLLASHAPVNMIVAGELAHEAEVKKGATINLSVDLSAVRVGMPVLLYDTLKRPVHGIIEDLAGGVAVTRVIKTADAPKGTPAATVTLPQGTRAQFGEAATLGTVAAVTDRTPERDQSAARTLEKMGERKQALEKPRAAPVAETRKPASPAGLVKGRG